MNKIEEPKKDLWNAEHYKKHAKGQFERGKKAVESLGFVGNEHVLDIGCGDGRITAEIAKHIPNGVVVGIDISENMINDAKKSFGAISNVSFVQTDATTFMSDKKFDIVVSFATLHWIKHQKKVLQNIFAVLKPGGRLYFIMAATNKGPISTVFASKKWRPYLLKQEPVFFSQDPETMASMLRESGFKDIVVDVESLESVMLEKDEIVNRAMAWVPHATGFNHETALSFSHDIADEVARQKKGAMLMSSTLLHARAVKP